MYIYIFIFIENAKINKYISAHRVTKSQSQLKNCIQKIYMLFTYMPIYIYM